MNALADLYQDVVLEHKRAPRHFGPVAAATHAAQGVNPSCGDSVAVQARVAHGRLDDLGFTGQGCAICIASTSMMCEALHGQDLAVARALHARFRAVLTGDAEAEGAALGKLETLAGVRQYPSRIKCALLGWHALMQAIGSADAAVPARPAPEPTP